MSARGFASIDEPLGPYQDVGGEPLVDPKSCPFAIDPHAFQDDDGQWYLFWARDFLDTEGGVRAGNEAGPRVLRSRPGRVLGPGHNSIVLGSDGQTEYIVYHAWDTSMEARRMCLDPLVWTPSGPRCEGPTWTPQTLVSKPKTNCRAESSDPAS